MIRLSISEQGGVPRLVTFNQDQVTLGRTAQCDLQLGGKGVSSTHCRLTRTAVGLQIEDLGSTNGTYVNRQRIAAPLSVGATDEIVVAMYRVQVIDDGATAAPGMSVPPSAFAPAAPQQGPTAHVPAQPAPIVPAGPAAAGMYRAGGATAAAAGIPAEAVPAAVGGPYAGAPPQSGAPRPGTPYPGTPAVGGSGSGPTASGPSGGYPTTGEAAAQGAADAAVDPADVEWAREWEKIDSLSRTWSRKGRDPKLLLRGARLKSAKAWLARGKGRRPPPKREQRDFIFASSRRRQLKIFGNVTVLGLVLGAAGVGGWYVMTRPPSPAEDEAGESDGGGQADETGGGGDEGPKEPARDPRKDSDAVARVADKQDDPVVATLLAAEAIGMLPERADMRGALAERVLRKHLLKLRGRPLLGHEKRINAVAFAPDGRWAITASDDQSARLWDLTGNAARAWLPLRAHSGGVEAVEVSPNGKYLFTAGDGGGVFRWDLKHADPPSTHTKLLGLDSGATDAAVSGDGRWLVVGGRGGSARVWDATSPSPRSRELKGHTAPIRAVDINFDGSRVLAASEDTFASMWRMSGGEPGRRTKYTGHLGAVNAIAIAPDGSKVLTGGEDGAKLWNPSRGSSGTDLVIEQTITDVAISPDSQLGVLVADDNTLRIWEIKNVGKVPEITFSGHKGTVHALSLQGSATPEDGQPTLAVSGSADGTARTWNLDSRSSIKTTEFGPHPGEVHAAALSRDGLQVLVGDSTGAARIWNRESSGAAGASLVGVRHRKPVTAVAMNPSGTRMVSTSADGTAVVWNLTNTGRLDALDTLKGHTGTVDAVAISGDGKFVATGDSSGEIRVWDLTVQKPGVGSEEGKKHKRGIKAVQFGPRSKRLLSLSTDGVNVWRVAKDLPSEKLTHKDELVAMALSGDGRWLLTASVRRIKLWDLTAGSIRESAKGLRHDHDLDIIGVAVDPEGKWAASSGKDAKLFFYDLAGGGKAKKTHAHLEPVDALAFSPDGRWLATGSRDKTIVLWDMTKKRPWDAGLAPLKGHSARIGTLQWSADSRWLLSGSNDKTLRLWDVSSKDAQAIEDSAVVLAGHEGLISGAALSPDGRLAVSGSFDRTARLWPLHPHALIPIACIAAGRNLTEDEWDSVFRKKSQSRRCGF